MQNTLDLYQTETSITLHKDIRFHPNLTFGEKMFLAEVQSLTQKNKNLKFPFSSTGLGKLFGVSRQTIFNWIRKLTDLELLEVDVDYNNKEGPYHFLKAKTKDHS